MSRFSPENGLAGGKGGGAQLHLGVWRLAVRYGQRDRRLVGITPAMREGSGMVRFANEHADRYFDVGIAEQHAVTLPLAWPVRHQAGGGDLLHLCNAPTTS